MRVRYGYDVIIGILPNGLYQSVGKDSFINVVYIVIILLVHTYNIGYVYIIYLWFIYYGMQGVILPL